MKESTDLLCFSCHRGIWAQRGTAVCTEKSAIQFLFGAQCLQCLKCGRDYLLILKGDVWTLIPGRGIHIMEEVAARGEVERAGNAPVTAVAAPSEI